MQKEKTGKSEGVLRFAPAALAAEPLFQIGNFPVTNSMLNAWIATGIFIVIALVASRRRGALVPRGVHNFIEMVIEWFLGQMDGITNDKKKTRVFFPLIASIFFFVLLNNWLGLLPGTGTIGIWQEVHGAVELVPLLRPAAADLNLTLALAVLSLIIVQFVGVKSTGLVNYGSKFVNIRGIFRALPKGPMAVVTAVIEFFVGLIEIIGEVARVASLSLRLFGNVFAGEILMTVMLSLASYVVPIPFMFLEILVGVIQATVFATLVLVFLVIATEDHGGHDDEHAVEHAH